MNNLQWATGETLKLDSKPQDLQKLKPFADLTDAMSSSIKDSISANNKITQEIVKGIETGHKQRKDIIDFYTQFAPETAGKIYKGIRNLKEHSEWAEKLLKDEQRLEDENEATVEIHNLLDSRVDKTSGMYAAKNNWKGANAALEGREARVQATENLQAYWEKIKPNVEEVMSTKEFVLKDGNTYTLATAPASGKLEIRNRIDVTIAAHALSTGGFTKRQVINGILRKSQKRNNELYIEDLAAESAQAKKETIVKEHRHFTQQVKNGNTSAFANAIIKQRNIIEAAKQDLKNKDPDAEYTGLSLTSWTYGQIESLFQLVEIGPKAGGLSATQVREQLTAPIEGGLKWGTKTYSNLLEAYNAQHAGKGDEWMLRLSSLEQAEWDKQKAAKTMSIEKEEHTIYEQLSRAKNDQEYTEILRAADERFRNPDLFPGFDESFLSQDLRNKIRFKDDNLFSAIQKRNHIISLYAQKKPVNPELIKALPEFMQGDINETFDGRVWSHEDTKEINRRMETDGILSRSVLEVAFGGIPGKDLKFTIGFLKDEINHKIMKNYDELILTNDHAVAVAQATSAVIAEYKPLIDAALVQGKGQKEGQEKLREHLIELGEEGILSRNEYRSPAIINRLVQERKNLLDVVGKNNEYNNYSLLQSEEYYVGEKDYKEELFEWLKSGGTTAIPNFYKALARKSGVPAQRVMLYRAEALSHTFGEKDQELLKEYFKNTWKKIEKSTPATETLIIARSTGQQNLIRLNKGLLKNEEFVSEQYYHGSKVFAKNNKDLTEYDSIENIDQADYKHTEPLSGMSVVDVQQLFGKGQYYNIGAFGIPNETEWNRIFTQLLESGKVKAEDKFDKDTQLKFYTQGVINQNRRLQEASGIVKEPTSLTEEELKLCNLEEQAFPLNKDLCELIHNSYLKKNKSKNK